MWCGPSRPRLRLTPAKWHMPGQSFKRPTLILAEDHPEVAEYFAGVLKENYDHCVQERLVLLYPVRRDRNHTDTTYRLVCVDLAQGGKQLAATSGTQQLIG